MIFVLNKILSYLKFTFKNILYIFLDHKALIALRKAKKLNKLVFIACDPRAAIRNLVDLARPNSKQYFGEPLVPVKAVPVDMFPYTKHCELIVYLERLSIIKERENKINIDVSNDKTNNDTS